MTKEQKVHIKELKNLYKKDRHNFAVLADCLFEYGQGKEAEKIIKDNLPAYPDYVTALLVLGKILYYKKSYEEAKEIFLKITKINNKCVKAYKFLGDIELKMDNRDGYLSFYTEILRYDAFSTNAKNVITLLGKKYDFATEDDLISKYYSDQNITLAANEAEQTTDQQQPPSKGIVSQQKSSVQSEFEKKISLNKSQIDLGNVNYKQAIKEINDQYVRNKKSVLSSSSIGESFTDAQKIPSFANSEILEIKRNEKAALAKSNQEQPKLVKQDPEIINKKPDVSSTSIRSKVEDLSKSKIDEFFQAQLAKPDKPKKDNYNQEKPLFHELPVKSLEKKPVLTVEPEINIKTKPIVPIVEENQPNIEVKTVKVDTFSDIEAMFEGVTANPANKPKISVSALEEIADKKNSALEAQERKTVVAEIIPEVEVEIPPKLENISQPEENKESEQEKKKSLKDFYQPVQSAIDQEADFDLVEDIRKSGEFDSLDDMMRHHSQENEDSKVEEQDSEAEKTVEQDHSNESSIHFKQNLLRNYDEVDLVEEERVYARAEDAECGGSNAAGTIQIDIDNSFKKVVVDKVVGISETPKKRSVKIATSTLGEIYAAQGEYHKAKENYYELMSKYPENGDYRIKYLQAEFNIASIRINEELDYYRNLMEQYPDMHKYSERFDSYQTEYNNLQAELELKIDSVKKKFQNDSDATNNN